MSKKHRLSADYVRQCLRYEDGKLFWLVRPVEHFKNEATWKSWNKQFAGNEAGCVHPHEEGDRWYICINYVLTQRSFVVWMLHKGEWPSMIVDHEDANTLNDRIENLRLATTHQSNANQKKKKKPGSANTELRGVQRNSQNTWSAIIRLSGKRTYLGSFKSPEEAHAAYMKAYKEHFKEFSCER